MTISFGKTVDLVLDAWTVAWARPFDPASVHGTAVKAGFENIMYPLVGIGDPAADLLLESLSI